MGLQCRRRSDVLCSRAEPTFKRPPSPKGEMMSICERKKELKRRRQRKMERIKQRIRELKAEAAKTKKK